ncbi:hypothetical protein N7532_009535 [Penicillium argentinense]|uniref:Uncharacterized protein n=1 Tax=Penicillium argentinense TaxID=1131581 RepID=A0A9W9EZN1_9EURO|nr:uncharacterized protein N7532_009535 [Penicillium argentinense]KAJ5090851.1 hypothetical protein N7532_009535 [Penicillium argentinense]
MHKNGNKISAETSDDLTEPDLRPTIWIWKIGFRHAGIAVWRAAEGNQMEISSGAKGARRRRRGLPCNTQLSPPGSSLKQCLQQVIGTIAGYLSETHGIGSHDAAGGFVSQEPYGRKLPTVLGLAQIELHHSMIPELFLVPLSCRYGRAGPFAEGQPIWILGTRRALSLDVGWIVVPEQEALMQLCTGSELTEFRDLGTASTYCDTALSSVHVVLKMCAHNSPHFWALDRSDRSDWMCGRSRSPSGGRSVEASTTQYAASTRTLCSHCSSIHEDGDPRSFKMGDANTSLNLGTRPRIDHWPSG